MSPEAQRIAIAKACGWRDIEYRSSPTHPSGYLGQDRAKDWLGATRIPDYLNDLNAMNDAEKVHFHAVGVLADHYRKELVHVMVDARDFRHELHATAAQRAEAFLRTLNLWKDDSADPGVPCSGKPGEQRE